MKRWYPLILCTFLSSVGCAQSFCEAKQLRYKAEQLYRSKSKLDSAMYYYQKAFSSQTFTASEYLDAVNCAVQLGNQELIVASIEEGYKVGLTYSNYKLVWSYKGEVEELNRLMAICDTVENERTYRVSLNTKLINKMALLAKRDQEFRSDEQEDKDSQRRLDSLNWKDLKDLIIAEDGLPTYEELGRDGYNNLEILFYHMDKNELEFFLLYIIKSSQQGKTFLGDVLL